MDKIYIIGVILVAATVSLPFFTHLEQPMADRRHGS